MPRVWEATTPDLIELNRKAVARGATNCLSDDEVATLDPDAGRTEDEYEYYPHCHEGHIILCHSRGEDGRLHRDSIVLMALAIEKGYGGVHFIDATLNDIFALPSRYVEGEVALLLQETRDHFAIAISDYDAEALDEEVSALLHRRR